RRDRVRIHHGAQRDGVRDRLRLYQFRQRDDVPADPADPALVDRHEWRAYALGKGAASPERPALMGGERKTLRNTLVLIAGLLAFWQLVYWIIGDVAMRSPWQTMRYTVTFVQSERFWTHLPNTLQAFAVALGLHRLSAEAMEPMLVALYSIPKITLYPIILLAFGLGMSAKIAFGAIHGIVPVALFTLNAVRSTRPILVKPGRVLKLSPPAMVRSILFPAAVPEIFTGLRVGFSLTLIGTVLGEMFAAQHGLGY